MENRFGTGLGVGLTIDFLYIFSLNRWFGFLAPTAAVGQGGFAASVEGGPVWNVDEPLHYTGWYFITTGGAQNLAHIVKGVGKLLIPRVGALTFSAFWSFPNAKYNPEYTVGYTVGLGKESLIPGFQASLYSDASHTDGMKKILSFLNRHTRPPNALHIGIPGASTIKNYVRRMKSLLEKE